MKPVTNFDIDTEVRWFYQINKWSKPTDENVFIGSSPMKFTENKPALVKIYRMKNGNRVDGGYVNENELFEL